MSAPSPPGALPQETREGRRQARWRALQGSLLAFGAPAGWLAVRYLLTGADPVREVGENPMLYAYLAAATLVVFALFGWVLGAQEDRLHRLNRDLGERSITDGLTGLRNRQYFFARFEEELSACERERKPLSVAIIDLDHFKSVNDRHGHLAGDQLLAACAAAIRSVVRQDETAARVGGEEFGLILPGSDKEAATRVAERVRAAVKGAQHVLSNGRKVSVSASVGVATARKPAATTSATLYGRADAGLYRAKQAGRDRVVALEIEGTKASE